MKVKFIQSIAGNGSPDGKQFPNFGFKEGYVGIIIDDKLAQAWIDSGICVAAEPTDKCRPPKPEFAVSIPVETAMARRGPGRPKSVSVPEAAKSVEVPETPVVEVEPVAS